jgi:6-phosphogluconate dehydrogenase
LEVGEGGSGHFVKMVHNGIEYGDMQLIAEASHLLANVVGLNHDEMADVSVILCDEQFGN